MSKRERPLVSIERKDLTRFVPSVAGVIILNVSSAEIHNALATGSGLEPRYRAVFYAVMILLNAFAVFFIARLVRKREVEKFVARTENHHSFAHHARDLGLKLMGPRPDPLPYCSEIKLEKPATGEMSGEDNDKQVVAESLIKGFDYHFNEELLLMLESMCDMFRGTVPKGTRIWACIRELRTDGAYHTFLRTSGCNVSRQAFTEPVSKNSAIVDRLKYSYKHEHDCVIITGQGKKGFMDVKNNAFKEDLSILMGAVLSKSWVRNKEFRDPKLNWIVCLNADVESVFDESHIPLMKACNDVFSWILNSFARHDSSNRYRSVYSNRHSDLTD